MPCDIETLERHRSFGGVQGVYRHTSEQTGTPMTFSVYTPPLPGPRPVVWFLSGLTCTDWRRDLADSEALRRLGTTPSLPLSYASRVRHGFGRAGWIGRDVARRTR